jgi:hypothetical protein
LNLPLKN